MLLKKSIFIPVQSLIFSAQLPLMLLHEKVAMLEGFCKQQ